MTELIAREERDGNSKGNPKCNKKIIIRFNSATEKQQKLDSLVERKLSTLKFCASALDCGANDR